MPDQLPLFDTAAAPERKAAADSPLDARFAAPARHGVAALPTRAVRHQFLELSRAGAGSSTGPPARSAGSRAKACGSTRAIPLLRTVGHRPLLLRARFRTRTSGATRTSCPRGFPAAARRRRGSPRRSCPSAGRRSPTRTSSRPARSSTICSSRCRASSAATPDRSSCSSRRCCAVRGSSRAVVHRRARRVPRPRCRASSATAWSCATGRCSTPAYAARPHPPRRGARLQPVDGDAAAGRAGRRAPARDDAVRDGEAAAEAGRDLRGAARGVRAVRPDRGAVRADARARWRGSWRGRSPAPSRPTCW